MHAVPCTWFDLGNLDKEADSDKQLPCFFLGRQEEESAWHHCCIIQTGNWTTAVNSRCFPPALSYRFLRASEDIQQVFLSLLVIKANLEKYPLYLLYQLA